jgi:hypothetical protein
MLDSPLAARASAQRANHSSTVSGACPATARRARCASLGASKKASSRVVPGSKRIHGACRRRSSRERRPESSSARRATRSTRSAPSVRLFVATQPVDGRKGPDSLMALVRDVFRHDPLSGHLFVFFPKRCDRVCIVYWDRMATRGGPSASRRAGSAPRSSGMHACRRWRSRPPSLP